MPTPTSKQISFLREVDMMVGKLGLSGFSIQWNSKLATEKY